MKVRTLREHTNIHGHHKVGEEYEHPAPATDIHFGYVEAADSKPSAQKAAPQDKPAA